MLDIEVVAGICPKAKIVVYFAQFGDQGFVNALNRAFADQENNPGVISISWGFAEGQIFQQAQDGQPEEGWTPQAMNNVNRTLKTIATANIATVCVAAGDDGSCDGITTDGLAHVDFPASSPYVLSVGGTIIKTNGSSSQDIVWMEGTGVRPDGGATGGGASMVPFSENEARPPWQKNIPITSINTGAIAGRVIPDLAANAGLSSAYQVVINGGTDQLVVERLSTTCSRTFDLDQCKASCG